MAAAKRKTRAELEADLVRVKAAYDDMVSERNGAATHNKQLRTSLDEVKERLAFSESEVQRMGGYISRVQEDDVVRDPLVQVGDPDGEQQLVPKRKPTHFHHLQPAPVMDRHAMLLAAGAADPYRNGCATDRPGRQRHWVTY